MELVVTLGSYRRAVVLPDGLRQREVVRAGVVDGTLEVEFAETVDANRDPLQELLARHQHVGRTKSPRPPGLTLEPETMSRICDLALAALSVVSRAAATAEAAVLLQRQRFRCDGDDTEAGHPNAPTARSQQIHIEF